MLAIIGAIVGVLAFMGKGTITEKEVPAFLMAGIALVVMGGVFHDWNDIITPYIGSLLSGDVFSRYYRLRGFDTLYVSGSDMHGTRMEIEAGKQGISPKELTKRNHNTIKKLLEDFNIEFDNYTSTESETHKEFVKEIYRKIESNGYILTKTEKRAFCRNFKGQT